MARHKFYYHYDKTIRTTLNNAVDLAMETHNKEKDLIRQLYFIDQKRYYIFYGLKSLTGFCLKGLRLTKTQAQRIITQVRRYEPKTTSGKKRAAMFDGQLVAQADHSIQN